MPAAESRHQHVPEDDAVAELQRHVLAVALRARLQGPVAGDGRPARARTSPASSPPARSCTRKRRVTITPMNWGTVPSNRTRALAQQRHTVGEPADLVDPLRGPDDRGAVGRPCRRRAPARGGRPAGRGRASPRPRTGSAAASAGPARRPAASACRASTCRPADRRRRSSPTSSQHLPSALERPGLAEAVHPGEEHEVLHPRQSQVERAVAGGHQADQAAGRSRHELALATSPARGPRRRRPPRVP